MKKLSIATICGMALYSLFVASPQAMGQGVMIAELGGVSMITIPQPSPGAGLMATKVVLQTDPANKLVTYENIQTTDAYQVWLPGAFGGPPGPTPYVDSAGWGQLPPEWIATDSHILITPSMVAGGAGMAHAGIGELNDEGNQGGTNESLPLLGGQAPAVSGVGPIAMDMPTDAFFVAPEFQINTVDLGYFVTQTDDGINPKTQVELTVGVLGEGIVDSGQPGGASFGFNGNDPVGVFIPVPEPATALLAGFASLAVLGFRRRRNG